jgi:hypothetical protein
MNDMENNTEKNDMQQNDIINRSKDFTLLEMLDRVLNKGVIIAGDVVISVADVDLVYLGVKLMLSSVETMEKLKENKQ